VSHALQGAERLTDLPSPSARGVGGEGIGHDDPEPSMMPDEDRS